MVVEISHFDAPCPSFHVLIAVRDRTVRSRWRSLMPWGSTCVEVETDRAALAAFAAALNGKPFHLVVLSFELATGGDLEVASAFRFLEARMGTPPELGASLVLIPPARPAEVVRPAERRECMGAICAE